MHQPEVPPRIEAVLSGYAPDVREGVLRLRALIYETAAQVPGVGRLQETLKWGQPAYLTPWSRSATTLRLGPHRAARFALFAHCRTSVISDFAMEFPDGNRLEGNRAVLFDSVDEIAPERLQRLIRHALTYHRAG